MSKKATTAPNELALAKPVAFWKKSLSFDRKSVLTGLGKIGLKAASFDWGAVGEAALETIGSSVLTDKPEEVGFLLVYRSFISAITKLGEEYSDLFKDFNEQQFNDASKEFEDKFENIEVTIGLDFFNRPSEAPFLDSLKGIFKDWLSSLGMNDKDALIISRRLKEFFVFQLNNTWREKPDEYAILKNYYENSPFIKGAEKEYSWQLYNESLVQQVDKRMFSESFGLSAIYIPLTAYYHLNTEKESKHRQSRIESDITSIQTEKIVLSLDDDFQDWVKDFSSKTALRIINGGPGSGKSTFTKMLAYWVVSNTDISTVYVPLHLFDITGNLLDAFDKFVRNNRFLPDNPLDPKMGKKKLLIIFDGLDELALRGKTAYEATNSFVEEVIREINRNNAQQLQHKVIITGRPIAIQSVANKLRETKQIFEILPYRVENKNEYIDNNGLLDRDKRHDWWQKFGTLSKKREYEGVPKDLLSKSLQEITAQPLLNYLVAITFESELLDFKDDTTLNKIYEGLIQAVYYRQYEKNGRTVDELGKDQFIRVLEEIALTMWHSGERLASLDAIVNRCVKGGVKKHLKKFNDGFEFGVTKLLIAFYSREGQETVAGEKTFEFTHKSFSEYLTARRLFRFIKKAQKEIVRREEDPDDGWTIHETLKNWAELFYITPMDEDLLKFIQVEFKNIEIGRLLQYQKLFARMISFTINHGFPIRHVAIDADFYKVFRFAKNSDEALLAFHYIVAQITGQQSELTLKNQSVLGTWLKKLGGQKVGPMTSIGFQSLGMLIVQNQILYGNDLICANFLKSDLSHLSANYINLCFCNLKEANLTKAKLVGANLIEANLIKATLKKANLGRANLRKADLGGADLKDAYLIGANLGGANFRAADLGGANLGGANLELAILERANLKEAYLGGADLREANLGGANLRIAKFERANLQGANLEGVNLRGANFDGANLEGANLRGANLEGVSWKDANIRGAYLDGVKLYVFFG